MDENQNKIPVFVVEVPLEIISLMLSFLPDKQSLLSAILCCRGMNYAYLLHRRHIVSSILVSRMYKSVNKEAALFYRICKEQWDGARAGVRAIRRIFTETLTLDQDELAVTERMPLGDIQLMYLFHEDVEWWTNRIITNLKRTQPLLCGPSPFQATPAVENRFKRAIYRLYSYISILEKTMACACADNEGFNRPVTDAEREETSWCSLLDHLEEHRILRAFYSHFSTAEVEQMMVICELLVSEITPCTSLFQKENLNSFKANISPAINVFMQYDIEMGCLMPGFVDEPKFGMPMVVQGLRFMREFVHARNYNHRGQLLNLVNRNDWIPGRTTRAYFPTQDHRLQYDLEHCGLDSEDLKELANEPDPLWVSRVPFYNDGDSGPQLAWRKFNDEAARFGGQSYNTGRHARPLAYVFWDGDMLAAANLLHFNEDGAPDLKVVIPPAHDFYRTLSPYTRWKTVRATQWAFLARYIKTMLRDVWGRVGWFNAGLFSPDVLKDMLEAYGSPDLTVAEWQILFQAILHMYCNSYCMLHPYNYLNGAAEMSLF